MTTNISSSTVPEKQKGRFEKLKKLFLEHYDREPEFLCRAPGRVNLIGEHIDYCGYSVLPMAVEQDIVIAAAPSSQPTTQMLNTNPLYPLFQCPANNIDIDRSSPKWFHYVLCGYKGIVDHFALTQPVGMDLLVDGTVPPSAGLSSSSALVCCAAMVTMHCNKKHLSKVELSELCQHCERHIGTEGGGMDQAISFLAEEGKAKHIEFNPLRATDVQLPGGVVFVISNCCVEMNKAATDHFNVRVAECRLATQVLSKKSGIPWQNMKRLGELQDALGKSLSEMLQLVESSLHKEPYSKQEICEALGVTVEELDSTSLSARSRGVASFKLYERALHVYGEASRVIQFKQVCDASLPNAAQTLGELMNQSHSSCSQLYECSCQELDQLCAISLEAGALGSRLTGAGWGGCAVSVVPAVKLNDFLSEVTEKYYKKDTNREAKSDVSLFATQPSGGAAIYIM